MKLISLIIPIYNSEKFLDRCIQSIINQTYKNIEIILVNDGSIDQSLEICQLYKKRDNRIVIINKKNGGVGSARNIGLQKAKGDYIGFIDSDDYIDKETYEEYYNY
ncbi:MAG: glycosyltransferase, partial [Eubacterium sp.]